MHDETPPVVYLVEDDPTVRLLIETLLEQVGIAFESFETSGDFRALIDRGDLKHPSMLLCDIHLPDLSGLELQKELLDAGILVPTLFMTAFGNIEDAVLAMERGAHGYITKPFKVGELVNKINEALAKNHLIDASRTAFRAQHEEYKKLTPRQTQILELLVSGQSSKEIARVLDISPRTVDVHRAQIMQRLEVGNAAELVSIYWKMKMFFSV